MEAEPLGNRNASPAPAAVLPTAGVAPSIFSQKGSARAHDFYRLIPSAGLASASDRFTAKDAIQCNIRGPHTSPKVNSYATTSGAAFVLPGDLCSTLSQMRSAGRATGPQQTVGNLLSSQFPVTSIGQFLLEQQEKIYRGVYSKPLGRSVPHTDAQLPDQDGSFRFGIKQSTDEVNAAKKLIFAPVPEPTPEELALYKQTHHAYLPGEPVDRGYNVKHIDMRTFCFGKKSATDSGTDAKQCINWIEPGESDKVVSKAIKDYHIIRHPEVGKTTTRAAGQPPVPPGFSFGLPTRQDAASAKECFKMCVPDVSQVKRATKNDRSSKQKVEQSTESAGAEERVFGIPTVRTDIKPPKRRPIVDYVNYGDEPAVGELLFPSPLTIYGVKDEDFLTQHSKEQIRRLLNRSIGSSGDNGELVFRAVDLAFQKVMSQGPPSATCKQPHEAVRGKSSSQHDGATPTISLADVLDAYAALIKKKVALETRSLTQATELYLQQSPAITLH